MNDPKSQSTGGTQDASTIQTRLERLRLDLSAHQARLVRASFLTAIIGVVLCGLMAVYFGVFYWWVSDLLSPKKLADVVEDMLATRLPKARKELEPEYEPDEAQCESRTHPQPYPQPYPQPHPDYFGISEKSLAAEVPALLAIRMR